MTAIRDKRIHERARDAGISKPLTREQNDLLYQEVIKNDKDAIKKMIEGNMALVIVRVESFLVENPKYEFLRDDLQAEGMLALTLAVNRMAETGEIPDANPVGFMYVWIDHSIGQLAFKEDNLCGSMWQIMRDRENGKKIPERTSFKNLDESTIDPCAFIDLRDSIRGLATSERESQYIDLREQGYTIREIADRLEISRDDVNNIRRRLRKRYQELEGEM